MLRTTPSVVSKELLRSKGKLHQLNGNYDVSNLPQLVDTLRQKLNSKDVNIVIVADMLGLSKTFLYDFKNGKAVCMDVLNRLANHFEIKYVITNFDTSDLNHIAWIHPSQRN